MQRPGGVLTVLLLPVLLLLVAGASAEFVLLDPAESKPLFNDVNLHASGPADQGPVNEPAFEWAKANVPFFECDDADLQAAYAFRWRAYFTHIIPTNNTNNPWVISECYSPTIPGRCNWGAPTGTINAAAGHHIREGRWIRDPIFMDSYIRFWYGIPSPEGGANSAYSGDSANIAKFCIENAEEMCNLPDFLLKNTIRSSIDWIAHATWARTEVSGDSSLFLQMDEKNSSLLEHMEQCLLRARESHFNSI